MLMGKSDIEKLIPHAGTMCLLDNVLQWDAETIHCTTITHRCPRNPLRNTDGLSNVHAIEYGAQSMAVHGALQAGTRTQQGYVASVRNARLHVECLDQLEGELHVRAKLLSGNSSGLIYETQLEADGIAVAEARIAILFRDEA